MTTDTIINALDTDDPITWDELVDATGLDEDTLDTKIGELQFEGTVRVRGREPHGFYLTDEGKRDNDDV
ncbi:hypothetical protein HWV07_04275 [Natronomonas salina]|uniref:DUF5805 domain-containing protein n=1 Tax=Natronomonas salina TaxID=1710540 RepID=UPI0015B57B32|nr:DUF5805 domain-containing protein [Natronomonas salina]QLD88290.1 hypothetical protein HWV07_04275 [Natronomonas salina]